MSEELRGFAERADGIELSGIGIGNRKRGRAAAVIGVERMAARRAVGIARIARRGTRQRVAATRGRIDAGRRQRRAVAIAGDVLKRRRNCKPIVLVVQNQRSDVGIVEGVDARAYRSGKYRIRQIGCRGVEE